MTDERDLSTKAATKAMRKILQGSIAHSFMMLHLPNKMGELRHKEAASFGNAWWQDVMGNQAKKFPPMFEREARVAAKLANEVGGAMKQTKDGIWYVDPANNPAIEFAPKEKRIVQLK